MRLPGQLLQWRLPHYAIAGVITLFVEYSTFVTAYYVFGRSGVIANSISFAVSLGINFLLNRNWVFGSRSSGHHLSRQAVLFVGLACMNLAITNIGLFLLLKLGWPAFIIKLLFVGMIATWNFVIFRRFIFSTSNKAALVAVNDQD